MKGITVIQHPLVRHNLTCLRDQRTNTQEFRRLLGEVASLMVYEATRSFQLSDVPVRTPLEATTGQRLKRDVVLIPVLRAGLGMLEPLLTLIPNARVGFIGLKREEMTLQAHFYHQSLPTNLRDCEIVLIDPMLATGGSALAALELIRTHGGRRIRLVGLVAAPEGVRAVRRVHPKLPIFTAALDRELNERGYILPGLGDAGDRLFGV